MNSLTDAIDSLSTVTIGTITLMSVLSAVLVFLICLVAITVIMRIVDQIQKKSKFEKTVNSFIRSSIKVALWIIAIVIVADKLGIPTTSLVTLIGVAGLALSLSVQGILSNLFSGLTMLTTKPFSAGDYVELDGVSGVVKEVDLFYTTMTTLDNKVIYVPNSEVAGAKIINYTRQINRRVDLTFTVSYDDPTEAVKAALMEAMENDERILNEPAPPFAGLLSYKESSIEYVIRAWTKQENYWDLYFALNERVREMFDKHDIELTYNHLNVHLVDKK